jgi:hypothetical protein
MVNDGLSLVDPEEKLKARQMVQRLYLAHPWALSMELRSADSMGRQMGHSTVRNSACRDALLDEFRALSWHDRRSSHRWCARRFRTRLQGGLLEGSAGVELPAHLMTV